MNDKQTQTEIVTILNDIATLLRKKGKTDKEIDETFIELTTEVELAMVDELITVLPPDQKKLYEEMTAQNKSAEEIAAKIQLDPQQINSIEMRKFKEIFGKFVASLDAQK